MSKSAIIVFSDPKAGGDEALGRLFNALFLTLELQERDAEVKLIFQGAGSRWPAELVSPGHPAGDLYRSVQQNLVGVCGECADVFGATEGAESAGATLVRDRSIPGTTGVLDLSRYVIEEYQLVVF